MNKKAKIRKASSVPEIKTNYRCLLVRINEPQNNEDDTISNRVRCLFTELKNYRYLVELSRSFGIELLSVRVKKATILPLKNLIDNLKFEDYHDSGCFSVILDRTPGKSKPSFIEKKNSSNMIHSLLLQAFIDGFPVRIKTEAEIHGVSESTIRRHIKVLQDDLKKQNMEIIKINPGSHQLVKSV